MSMNTPSSAFELLRYIRETSFSSLVVLVFTSPQVAACEDLLVALNEFSGVHPEITFAQIDINRLPEAVEYFKVTALPLTLVYQATSQLHKLEGSDVPWVLAQISSSQNSWTETYSAVKATSYEKIQSLIGSAPLVLFIKGSPAAPKCKFTKKLLGLLSPHAFESVDILEDDSVREWMKQYSNWPTFPQVYFKGEFLGGVDIIEEMHNSGELRGLLSEVI